MACKEDETCLRYHVNLLIMFVYIVGYMLLKEGVNAIICDEGFSLPSENAQKARLCTGRLLKWLTENTEC